jgi:DNA-binding winged helix-turn-helix (wHTH) protein/TolB-like protein
MSILSRQEFFADKECDMTEQNECLFDFESFRIDPLKRQLLCDGQIVPLTSKAFTALLLLVGRRGEVVSKEELMNALWFDTAVEENNLTQQISTLRKKLGEKREEPRFIVTIPGQGYSFIAPVKKHFYGESDFVLQEITKSSITIDISDDETPQVKKSPSKPFLNRANVLRQLAISALVIAAFLFVSFWLDSYQKNVAQPRTIAVLPFKSLNTDTKNDVFAAGITDTLTAKIGNLKSLTVRPVDGSAEYIGQEQSPLEAGRKLNVETVLAGSVQREGERIRVTIQVLDIVNQRVVWGQSFNKDINHSFDLQDAISEEVAAALQVKFSS